MGQAGTVIYIVLLIAAFYFLVIRPQSQRQKQQRQLVASLTEGDRVITAGGVYGIVAGVGAESVRLQVADDVVIEVAKGAIAQGSELAPGTSEE